MKQKLNIVLITLAFFTIIFTSCNKKGNEAKPGCSITDEQIAQIGPPSYEHALKACETIISKDSALLDDPETLSCMILTWLKDNPEPPQKGVILDTRLGYMNDAEYELFKWGIWHDPLGTYAALSGGLFSFQHSDEMYACDKLTDTKRDAFRHALWNALTTAYGSEAAAIRWGNAHETAAGNTEDQLAMDTHNNNVGRTIGQLYPLLGYFEMGDVIAMLPYKFVESPGSGIPSNYSNTLVYFKNKQPYDVELSGTFTNPDSGKPPFEVVFSLNQCDNIVRGVIAFTREGGTAYVRVNGKTTPTGINLFYAIPNYYENVGDLCLNVNMVLTGSPESLSGYWTSTNCTQGGVIELIKSSKKIPIPQIKASAHITLPAKK